MNSTRNNAAVAPVRFPLSSQSPGEALTVIGYVTNEFNDLPEEVYQTVVNNITTHWGAITYGYLKGPATVEAIKIIIGRDGCFMKKTTDQTGAYFLWHDRQKNIFMFWGEHMSVIKAMHAIRYRIEKYGTPAAPATLAPMSSDEVDEELAYYERKEALEAEREPEQPVFDLPLVSPVLPFAKRTANDDNSDDNDESYVLSDLSDLYFRRSISRGKKCDQTLAANNLRASSAPSSSSAPAVYPCIGRTSSAPVQVSKVPEPESPLPVLEPCPFACWVDDFIGIDDEDTPTIESIEKRFQDGLIYLENNPDLVNFVENRVLPSIGDIAISHLPNFTRMKNDLGFKNEAPCDFAMYLATLHTRLLKAKFEVAEREYENYKKNEAAECENSKPIIMDYFEAKPHLEKFVREFDEPMGFVWSTDPCIDELYNNLCQETDSPSSFALYLRELQAFLKKEYEKKNVHVNRCIICQVDMGDCNPRQYCGKTKCVRGW